MSHNQVSPGTTQYQTPRRSSSGPSYTFSKLPVLTPGHPPKPTSIIRCRSEEIPFNHPPNPILTPTSCPCCPSSALGTDSLSNSQLSPGAFSKLFSDNISSCSSVYSPTKSGMKNGICGQNEVEISVCTVTHLPSPSSRRKTMKLPLGAAGDHKNTLVTINSEEELFYINPATSRSDKKYTKCLNFLGIRPHTSLKDFRTSFSWEMYQNLPLVRSSAFLSSLTPFHFYFTLGIIGFFTFWGLLLIKVYLPLSGLSAGLFFTYIQDCWNNWKKFGEWTNIPQIHTLQQL